MKKRYFSIFCAILLSFFLFVSRVYAGSAIPYCNGDTGISTAIGCISFEATGLMQSILSVSVLVSGGISFIIMMFGGLQLMISAGDPKRLQAGREKIEGAIIGLLLIVGSIFILRIVGVQILAIPGFG